MKALTTNEQSLLKLVCRDKNNSEIADAMGYSLRYVEKIKTELYLKTKTKSNLGLYKWAVKTGLHIHKN